MRTREMLVWNNGTLVSLLKLYCKIATGCCPGSEVVSEV